MVHRVRMTFYCLLIITSVTMLVLWNRAERRLQSIKTQYQTTDRIDREYPKTDRVQPEHEMIDQIKPNNQIVVRSDRSHSGNTSVYSNITQGGAWGQDHGKHIKYSNFTRMKYGPIYIFGATMGNVTSHWDIIKMHASMGVIYTTKQTHFSCCLKYIDESRPVYKRQKVFAKYLQNALTKLSAYHFTCLNPNPGVVPHGVALTVNNYTCSEDHVTYRKPMTPLRESGVRLALCTKLTYGLRSAELIIEFMEVYKYLGVDKFVSYFLENLNEDTRKVLEYYAATGILDLYHFQPAEADKVPRSGGRQDDQSRSDKQLLVFDAFERMSGYTYFGVIDHDEFLIPSRNRSLKQLLADLYKEEPTAAGFAFMSQYIFPKAGRHGTVNDLILGTYITTSSREPKFKARKNIYKPELMNAGCIHTHHPKVRNRTESRIKEISSEEGYMRHFRDCHSSNMTKAYGPLINDSWLAEWSTRIQYNVENVRYLVFGNSSYAWTFK